MHLVKCEMARIGSTEIEMALGKTPTGKFFFFKTWQECEIL